MATNKPKKTYSIPEFCDAHGMGRTHLYALWKIGQGPRCMQVGHRRLISLEAAADWRKRMEVIPPQDTRPRGKHTPGPWAWDDRQKHDCYAYIIPASGSSLSTIGRVELPFANEGEGHANARLMASAPELLQALKELIGSATDKASKEVRQAKAAVRKATGESL